MDEQQMVEMILGQGGTIITGSARIRAGVYSLGDATGRGAIRIEADDVVVDFGGAVITGNDAATPQERFEGVGILIEGKKNVTIRNAVVSGYHHNIRVTNCENVVIEDCDVSRSRGHRIMRNGIPVDHWLEIRDLPYWREYGSGIWLEDCENATVRRTRGLDAQNGIILLGCSHSVVTECDFSFNSGWGIALMRSCDNVISWCYTDFVNRYYVGLLGADSAAVAVADSSHRNYFVGLSMTHGGDGFFLTNLSDLGHDEGSNTYVPVGGSDDNIIAYCDGSWSPANAFEGTFSQRCVYYRNFADHSGHGFWLGFSDNSPVLANSIKGNANSGISIPDGRGNRIEGNEIADTEGPAIRLWGEETVPGAGFPSTDVEIRGNVIRNASAAYDLANTTDYLIVDNSTESAPVSADAAGTKQPDDISATERFLASPAFQRLKAIVDSKPEGFRLYRDAGLPLGIEWVQLDDYAPRDFRCALAAYRQAGWGALEVFVIDPERTTVEVPVWAKLTRKPDDQHRCRIEAAVADGRLRNCDIAVIRGDRRQTLSGHLVAATWTLKWHDLNGAVPMDAPGWESVFAGTPVLEQMSLAEPEWPLQPAKSLAVGVPADYYALEASTRVCLPAGKYALAGHFTSGGLRMLVDGRMVVNNWEHNRYGFAEGSVDLAEGEHEITVRYYKGEGRVRLTLYCSRSDGAGSPTSG